MLADKQAEYALEQMRVYLEIGTLAASLRSAKVHKPASGSNPEVPSGVQPHITGTVAAEEYQQVEIIFNALLNVMPEDNYKILANTLCNTRKQLNSLSGRSFIYWSAFVRYMHWKLTGRVED
uniref:Uncharacterized protein n=1 Tax=Marseillevirus LCMAC201 TaxID=2506605 RepID=A0A481YW91_9VIRU|nr:MAG: hypothetical protein LCMAC201_02990 [Marseillevirus LCMAC201]